MSLGRKAHFLLSLLQPIPSGHQGCGRRLTEFLGSTAQHEIMRRLSGKRLSPRSEGKLLLILGMPAQSLSPLALVPCSFHQLQFWLCHDSHSLSAGQDTDLNEPLLDSSISSAECSISLIKQQITKPDESYDSSPNCCIVKQLNKLPPNFCHRGEKK